jgi:hypothetical protein
MAFAYLYFPQTVSFSVFCIGIWAAQLKEATVKRSPLSVTQNLAFGVLIPVQHPTPK